MRAVVAVRIPLRDSPRPATATVLPGTWRTIPTHGGREVEVTAPQTCPVVGWWDDRPQCHTVLNVEVEVE